MAINRVKSNLRARVRWGIAGILVLLLAASAFDVPQAFNKGIDLVNSKAALGLPRLPEKVFRLGLDLQGGAHLVYQAEVKNIPTADRGAAVEGVRDVIERRVNGLGVGETVVQTTKVGDDYRLIVELPGVTDIQQAIKLIGETPILEFKEQNTDSPRELTEDEQKQLEEFNATAKKRAEEALRKITKEKKDFSEAAKEYSEDEGSKNNGGYLEFVKKNAIDSVLYEWASQAKEGEVSKTVIDSIEGLHILKRGKERDGDLEVTASHILICYEGAQGCTATSTKEMAQAKANELFAQANAENFAQLAKENSTDLGSKDKGGDLGTFPRGVMVKPFEEAAFAAQVGQIVGTVETDFGYHIIYKTGENRLKEYELWRILVRTKKKEDFIPPPEPWKNTNLSGKQLERAEVATDPQTGSIQVSLQFNDDGKELFKQITERNLGKPVAIFLDNQPISIPTVQSVIPSGQAVITGQFSLREAQLLSQRLNAGALPVPIEKIEHQYVEASLGKESLKKSLYAGLVGTLLVMVFMFFYYRLPGLLAVIALTSYVAFTIALMKLFGVTLSLAGIAGFILSIGMAVDANVLIFERLKEELRAGKSLKVAVEEGFLRAWTSIRDSNLSTLITCALLLWFGTSFVKGFAVTLTIGVLMSMFTAITVTRIMLRFVVPWFAERGNVLFLGFRK